ncbi:MAG: DUF4386 family protein [Gemmatimonadaceae bacterium]|nr:DUF4386 family protein [Gemmatimonadaceae bacterium]
MNASVNGTAAQQKLGGMAALYLAAAYLVAIPYFLVFAKYPSVVGPAEKVAWLVSHHSSMRVMYLITYIIFGIVLAVLVLTLYERLKAGASMMSKAAAVAGLVWAVALVASGMIFNAGVAAVVELNATSPAQAVAVWQNVEPIALGLGGGNGELLGGLWLLLISLTAMRIGALPTALNWLGGAIGIAGVLSVVPALRSMAYAFGLLQIVWFVWLGVVMLRTTSRPAEAAVSPGSARRPE